MAKMTFGDGLVLEVPLPKVETQKEIIVKEVVQPQKEVDLSPVYKQIKAIELKCNANLSKISETSRRLDKEIINISKPVKVETKEIIIEKLDEGELSTLKVEMEVLEAKKDVLIESNKELLVHSVAINKILNTEVKKQAILNIVLSIGIILSTIIKFI